MTTLLPGTSFTLEVQPVYDLREIAARSFIEHRFTDSFASIKPSLLEDALLQENLRHEEILAAIRDRAVAELGLPEDAAIDPDNGCRYV